jgi:hypothetical protein
MGNYTGNCSKKNCSKAYLNVFFVATREKLSFALLYSHYECFDICIYDLVLIC